MKAGELLKTLFDMGIFIEHSNNELIINDDHSKLTDFLIESIREQKQAIISVLSSLKNSISANVEEYVDIVECTAPCYMTASIAQQRMLFVESLAGDASYYNIPVAYRLKGRLDKKALHNAIIRLVENEDVLRATYILYDGNYIQFIAEPGPVSLHEVSIYDEKDKESKIKSLLNECANYKFDLKTEWPIRVFLIKIADHEHILSINIHHVAADGFSAKIILRNISEAYAFYRDEVNAGLPFIGKNGYQYSDYVNWQLRWKSSNNYLEAEKYWMEYLSGAPQLHCLPMDYTRPSVQTISGAMYRQDLPLSSVASISALARQFETTPFVIFQVVFASLLARYCGGDDILFGTAVANRKPLEFINTVGLFANTLALRYKLNDGTSFEQLLLQAKAINAGISKYQQFPFDELVNKLNVARDLSYNPLIQVMLVMQEVNPTGLLLEGLSTEEIQQFQSVAKFDCTLHIYFNEKQLYLNWEYNTDLFRQDTIKSMASAFESLLNICISSPNQNIHQVPLAGKDLLSTTNVSGFPIPVCVYDLIHENFCKFSNNIAITNNADSLTYAELGQRVESLAHHIYDACNGEITRIGVCVEKSIELIIAMLAIFRVGGVYVPLDPQYPKKRLEWMIEDSQIALLISTSITQPPIDLARSVKILLLDKLDYSQSSFAALANPTVSQPAYIIYTSGSTGKPKGVIVSHMSLYYSMQANRSLMQINEMDVMPVIGSMSFGVSLIEILLPLISGGLVQIVERKNIIDIEKLINATDLATVFHAVPSLMRCWLDVLDVEKKASSYPNLRLLLIGGEPVPHSLLVRLKKWRPDLKVLELYGMTECAVVCSSYLVEEDGLANYCIGTPHPNTSFYVLNNHQQLQPVGVIGELYIGGLSLADGYINQPAITADRFIANPFLHGEKIYRTGDRVRRLNNGTFEFIGRTDNQVSIRGVRVELGEIEALVYQVDGVKSAVAHVVDIDDEERILALYYSVDKKDAERLELETAIKAKLAQYLPDIMRPSIIHYLDEIPLNPNGKVDRKNLPAIVIDANTNDHYMTETEKTLTELCLLILQQHTIGVTANIFEVGVHSLMIAKIAAKIKSKYSVTIPFTVFFESPTIRGISAYIDSLEKQKKSMGAFTEAELSNGYDEITI